MTVLDERVSQPVAGRRFGQYLMVAVLAAALGAGTAAGIDRIAVSNPLSPAEIEQIRAAELVDHLRLQHAAQIAAERNAELVGYYRAGFMARVVDISKQRAADMARFRYGAWSLDD